MEDAFQPSKKRAAGREISRDNPGLDDDEQSSDQETGTFKKASEEVLATRRMVKVRRKEKVQDEAPSSNPFAGIQLVAPTAPPAVTKPEATTQPEAAGEETVLNEIDGKTKFGGENGKDKETEENNEAESKVEAETEEVEAESEVKVEADKDEKKEVVTENVEKKDVSLNSFQQLSSGQNAFTNLSGTGFSTSTFSFGSIKSDGSVFGTGSSPLFGLKTDRPSFGLGLSNNNNGSSSLVGNSSSSVLSKSEASSVPAMKEIEVETGEENEEAVFSAESVLYEFIGGGWKERGKGEIKINVSKPEKEKARLVMRARGNYRLILNASLFPDMKLTPMDKKGLSFSCANSTGEAASGGGFSTFALKFKDVSLVEEFRGAVAVHKGKAVEAVESSVLKTPENSPRASDE